MKSPNQEIEAAKECPLLESFAHDERVQLEPRAPLQPRVPSSWELSEQFFVLRCVRGQLGVLSTETAGLIAELHQARAELVECLAKKRTAGGGGGKEDICNSDPPRQCRDKVRA